MQQRKDRVGIGVDSVELERVREKLRRGSGLENKVLHQTERLAEAAPFESRVRRLAGRFAAKEAILKSLGLGLLAGELHDVVVTDDPNGGPQVSLTGRAGRAAEGLIVTVSITHDRERAFAVAAAWPVCGCVHRDPESTRWTT